MRETICARMLFAAFLLSGTAFAAEVKKPAPSAPETKSKEAELTILDLLRRGGPLMYPIYAASVLSLAFAIERAFSLRRRSVIPPEFVRGLRELTSQRSLDSGRLLVFCRAHSNPPARIFLAALKRLHRPLPEVEKAIEDAGQREARLLRRNTRVLTAVASVTPLLGLLGTVLGMISAFLNISGRETMARMDLLAAGIYQALVTTAAGLTVAIPSLVAYLVFDARIDRLVDELDQLALDFVDSIEETNGGKQENEGGS